MYVGFDDLWPQGGMNERGLWFDGFAAPAVKAAGSSTLPHFPGNIVDKAMAECTTVEDVVRLFSQYNRAFLTQGILMFADASGDAVSIEPDAMVRKTRSHFVQTNFHQSRPQRGAHDQRFTAASAMLERAGDDISIDLFRRILAATHQEGTYSTLYSNIYELRSRTMSLYYFHDFAHVVTFNLAEELKKGERVLDIPALFPRNAAAEAFAARRKESGISGRAVTIGALALLCTVIVITGYGWIHAGRGFRVGASVVAGAVVLVVLLSVLAFQMHPQSSAPWIEFSIGPAYGESAAINAGAVRSNGITLKAAVAPAYDFPAVRIIGPPWLSETRYSLNAVVSLDDAKGFRGFLQQELENRLRLKTHVDVRPFEVFVLTATEGPRLDRSHGRNSSTWIHERDARLQAASMERLASALEAVLGRPVIDETGISGWYDLEFGWSEDRLASVTEVLRDRFGLRLSSDKRDMEALIVDGIQPDPALRLLAQVGRIARGAPRYVRQRLANVLTIR
jgi:uncharacterized protein (TIGR03435 family)